MINLDNVTLISVAGVREQESLKAIKYSMRGIKFAAAKLISSKPVSDFEVQNIIIPSINYEEYNKFIVFDLHKHIDTDYALLVQDDGFVVNPSSWREDFLNYDYIGAPWAIPNDSFSYRDPMGNLIRVGNGGFSLRSRKLLSLATELDLPWQSYYGFYNEDGFFTCHNRSIYEENGCVYAPLDIAKYFSHEIYIPELEGITPLGFHGRGSKYFSLLNNYE